MDFVKRPEVKFSDQAAKSLSVIGSEALSILVGPNNSGKSYCLKFLTEKSGGKGVYIGPMRYWNSNLLSAKNPHQNTAVDHFHEVARSLSDQSNFRDLGAIAPEHSVVSLTDKGRTILTEVMRDVLGVELSVEPTEPENSMSQRYIKCDGHNISYASSGVRLVVSIVASLLNPAHSVALIDEPELGVSPESQAAIAKLILDPERRAKFLPHLSAIIIATHSSIFLDRVNCGNNYYVTKKGSEIDIKKAVDKADLNRIHFWLLGNRLEMINLPAAIIICEGKTDKQFLQRVIETKWPKSFISVIDAGNDDRVATLIKTASDLFVGLKVSPYSGRILAIFDKQHARGASESVHKLGVDKENIIIWDENGIEYYYPSELLKEKFGTSDGVVVAGDRISVGSISVTKTELCDFVTARLKDSSAYNQEFSEKFLRIAQKIIEQS